LVGSYFIKRSSAEQDESELRDAKQKVQELKGTKSKLTVSNIVFACDAGMGSSAMAATSLRNKLKKAGLNINVVNFAIDEIPSNAQIVITHESLTERARTKAPNAEHISIKNFMNSPEFDELIKRLA